jgi:hypothetical protein
VTPLLSGWTLLSTPLESPLNRYGSVDAPAAAPAAAAVVVVAVVSSFECVLVGLVGECGGGRTHGGRETEAGLLRSLLLCRFCVRSKIITRVVAGIRQRED